MSLLQTLVSAFKGGGGSRAPIAGAFPYNWPYWLDPAGTRPPYEYRGAVRRAFLENPVAQRAVRLVAEGVGYAPLIPAVPELAKLVAATSAGQSLLETLAAQVLHRTLRPARAADLGCAAADGQTLLAASRCRSVGPRDDCTHGSSLSSWSRLKGYGSGRTRPSRRSTS